MCKFRAYFLRDKSVYDVNLAREYRTNVLRRLLVEFKKKTLLSVTKYHLSNNNIFVSMLKLC